MIRDQFILDLSRELMHPTVAGNRYAVKDTQEK